MNKLLLNTGFLLLGAQANATVFNVNVLTDGVDALPGDGVCEMTASAGDCSLRAAINEANELGGSHDILLGLGTHELSITGDEDLGFAGNLNVIGVTLNIVGAGPGETVIDGLGLHGIFFLDGITSFTVSDLTLTRGYSSIVTDYRGAAVTADWGLLEVNNVEFLGNVANSAGAIFMQDGDVVVNDSYFVGNEAQDFGITNQFGSAIYVDRGALDVTTSTFYANDVGTFSVMVKSGQLNITNSTFADNLSGGIRTSNSPGMIRASTLQNSGGNNLSHYSADDTQLLEIGGSVLSDETGAVFNCAPGDKPTSLGYNVVTDTSCLFAGTGDQVNGASGLMSLADNGGNWPTIALASTASGLDLVPVADCLDATGAMLLVDQRGADRPSGTACDAGAFEFNASEIIFKSTFD